MFGIGLPELILIMAVALIVVGPEKLPELAKSLAKGVVELKKAASSLKDSLQEEAKPEWHPLASTDDAGKTATQQTLPGDPAGGGASGPPAPSPPSVPTETSNNPGGDNHPVP